MSYSSQTLLLYLGLPLVIGSILGLVAYFYNKNYAGDDKALMLESLVIGVVTAVLVWFVVRSAA